MPKYPQRTCISCRAKRGKTELLRLVVEDGKLLYDQKRVLGGRGYHVCPDVRCIEVLIRGKRLKRIFKVEVESLHQLKELLISEVIT